MNIHPAKRGVIGFSNDKNDCSVRAVVNATNMEYSIAYAALRYYGRKDNGGALTLTIAKAYKELGLKLIGIFGTTSSALSDLEDMHIVFGKENVRHYAGMTVERFIKGNPKGAYVCCSNNHAFAIIDGKLIDTGVMSAGKRITFIFKV